MTVRRRLQGSRRPASEVGSNRAGSTFPSYPEPVSRRPEYQNPTGLPDDLFLAICERNEEKVGSWARNATPPQVQHVADTLEAVPWCALTYRRHLLEALARHAGFVPTFLLLECIKDPALMATVAHNPGLSERQVDLLGHRFTELYTNAQWPLEPLARSLEGIASHGFEFGLQHIERLLRVALDRNWGKRRGESAAHRLAVATPGMQRAVRILSLIPQVSEEQLVDLVCGAMILPELLPAFLLVHPNAGPRVWLAALESEQEVMEKEAGFVLSEGEGSATHPEVRKRLIARADHRALRNLLLKFPLDDAPEIIQRFFDLEPEKLASTLADGPPELKADVPQETMLLLLKHPKQTVRALAFQALG